MSGLEKCVTNILRRCPRAALDGAFLLGLVYERLLGYERSCKLTLGYCKENYAALGLPSPEAVESVSRKVIHTWEND